jgi:WD40 repeat protein/class 3 adenylate cyclase
MNDTVPPLIPLPPTGTVTFLFTDIEGSTTRWEHHPVQMKAALDRHNELMYTAIESQGGVIFHTAGDGMVAAFSNARAALEATLAAQRALLVEVWPDFVGPIRVRMALHTGQAERRDGVYHAEYTLNRLARMLSAGHGGQILVSATTRHLLDSATLSDITWRDFGERWLKDLIRPLHIFQVMAPGLPTEFPPLKTLPGPGGTATSEAAAEEVENPYKGLRAFQEADAANFFGQEALIDRLVARLGEGVPLARFLAVVGPSGSGKSSVVRAGLLPALRRGVLPGSERWVILELIPGSQPLAELAAGLGRTFNGDAEALLADLSADEQGLLRVTTRLLQTAPGQPPELVLVVDQFEEVFTLVAEEPARVHFLESLSRVVTEPTSRVRVVVTLRADFYDRPLLYPDPGEFVRQRTEVVLPLTPDALVRAITEPARRAGVTVEPELVPAILRDVGEQPGTLPLLQYALTELFERRQERRLTHEAYRASGGVLGTLAHRADELYASVTPAEQALARQAFLRLITLGEGVEDTRRRVRRSELEALVAQDEIALLEGVLEQFSHWRLLTFDRDPLTGEATIEIAHEALLQTWGQLREWLAASRDALRVQRQLGTAASEWMQSGKDASFLASGVRLAQFAALAASEEVALTTSERAYLTASMAQEQQQEIIERTRQARELELARETANAQRQAASRLRGLVAALGIFLLVAGGLAVFAFRQQGVAEAQSQLARQSAATAEANRAQAEDNLQRSEALRLAAEANSLLAAHGDAELIALLSIRSITTQYSPQGDGVLAGAASLDYARHIFRGHSDAVNSAVFAPNGQTMLTGSTDKTARLWDIQTGDEVRRFTGHTDLIWAVAFAPDGKHIATASGDTTVRLWDPQSGAEVRRLTGHTGFVDAVAFAPNGQTLLTGSGDASARLWDVRTGAEILQLSHDDTVTGVTFSPDGKLLLTNSFDGTARLWDASAGTEIRRFSVKGGGLGVAFSPDGQYILTGSLGGDVSLWEVATGQLIRTLKGHTNWTLGVAFSPDGSMASTASDDGTARLWDLRTGTELRRLVGQSQYVRAAAFSPDGETILTAGYDKTARLWDTTPRAGLPRFISTAGVRDGTFSPDGASVLTGSYDGTVQLWETHTGREVRRIVGHTRTVLAVTFSPDGQTILTGGTDQTVRLWDRQTGVERQRFNASEYVPSAAFSPEGRLLLTGSYNSSKPVARLWDLQTGQEIRQIAGHGLWVWDVAFAPDGQTFLTAGGTDHTARLWETETGREVQRFAGHTDNLSSVAFSPDGKLVLTGGDTSARLWDAHTGAELRRFIGHTDYVFGATFSPDGNYVLTGSADKTARLWKAQTGQEVRRFIGHTAALSKVAYSPDGKYILTTSDDATARLWDADYHDTLRALCQRLPRDFSEEERLQYNIMDTKRTCPPQE